MGTTEQEEIIRETNVMIQRIKEDKVTPEEAETGWKKLKDQISDIQKRTQADLRNLAKTARF